MAEGSRARSFVGCLSIAVLVPIGLFLLLGYGLYDALHPDAPDPELRARASRRLATRTGAPPLDARTGCGLAVETRGAQQEPVSDVTVTIAWTDPPQDGWEVSERTDPSGAVVFEDLPCGAVRVSGVHSSLADERASSVELTEGERNRVTLWMLPSFAVVGTILDPAGSPIPGATVTVDFEGKNTVTADEQGQYRKNLRFLPGTRRLLQVSADAFGYAKKRGKRQALQLGESSEPLPTGEEEEEEVHELEQGDQLEVDLVLLPTREVRVWCAGLPDDQCNDMLVQCTHPLVPMGEPCDWNRRSGETICDCDDQSGAVAIRGAGRSTLVEPDETEAWLDFRDGGVLTGRVMVDGAPVRRCEAVVVRVPDGLEDLSRGIIAAQKDDCDAEGRFTVRGLIEGDWELVVESKVDGMGDVQRILDPLRVRRKQTTDAGDIDLFSGGGIEGVLIDPITGRVPQEAPIMGLKRGSGAGRSTPVFAEVDRDGTFALQGLSPGEWELCYFFTPHVKTFVTVEEGAITDGVVVESSEATALDTNGFSLAVEEGELVVQEVDEGSPAHTAGLLPGDRVEGVLVAGLDIGSHLGEHAETFMQLVLGHWDGPGVTLLLDRDGEALELELDW